MRKYKDMISEAPETFDAVTQAKRNLVAVVTLTQASRLHERLTHPTALFGATKKATNR